MQRIMKSLMFWHAPPPLFHQKIRYVNNEDYIVLFTIKNILNSGEEEILLTCGNWDSIKRSETRQPLRELPQSPLVKVVDICFFVYPFCVKGDTQMSADTTQVAQYSQLSTTWRPQACTSSRGTPILHLEAKGIHKISVEYFSNAFLTDESLWSGRFGSSRCMAPHVSWQWVSRTNQLAGFPGGVHRAEGLFSPPFSCQRGRG